jgi:coenzyme F420-0:L-glutamate ligase / coenzyme F420-1:gamma-L-glutamate ligase
MLASGRVTLCAVPAIPDVQPGDDLVDIVASAVDRAGLGVENSDIFVIAQKVVSKAEGRYVELAAIAPSPRALTLSAQTGKDPRLVEVILAESVRVVRHAPDVLIVEHRLGFVMANAGVDRSNVGAGDRVLLLPEHPDRSADELRAGLQRRFGKTVAVIVNDSFGRPWRKGTVGVALGAAGLESLCDLRGRPDRYGRKLEVTETAFADEVAAAASLVMGQADEGLPAVIVSGLILSGRCLGARSLIRPAESDLFR